MPRRRTNRMQRTPRLRLGSMAKFCGAGSRILDVMPSPAPKIRAALKLLSVLIIILVITIAMVLFSGQERRVAHLPDGSTIRLEGYAFQSNNVRYEFPNRRIIGGFAKVLPAWAKNKVKWLTPEVTSVVSPSFPREPVLSAAFSL